MVFKLIAANAASKKELAFFLKILGMHLIFYIPRAKLAILFNSISNMATVEELAAESLESLGRVQVKRRRIGRVNSCLGREVMQYTVSVLSPLGFLDLARNFQKIHINTELLHNAFPVHRA